MDGSRDAASIARTAPEDTPNTNADPPACLITASMSSPSRSNDHGVAPSPVSPRPRRS
jgi:hypothetical protein